MLANTSKATARGALGCEFCSLAGYLIGLMVNSSKRAVRNWIC